MNRNARAFVALMAIAGAAVLLRAFAHAQIAEPIRFGFYAAIALVASRMKVWLPKVPGTLSVNFVFVLLGIVDLGLAETLIIGILGVLVQLCSNIRTKPKLAQVFFNTGSVAVAIWLSYVCYHFLLVKVADNRRAPLLLLIAATVYFVANTVPVAVIISLTSKGERRSCAALWQEYYFWSFPYYLVGAGLAGMVNWVNRVIDWQTSLLVLPVAYLIYRSYRVYLQELENEKRHVEEIAGLHLRTIEALALAIEAKDHTTHDHLQRVRIYTMEVAKLLELDEEEQHALHAAALLHDIGKLAVPEHIISKPGRLTPEEFEKMKIHPVVGAEILERVSFPYPVVPIVRAHHEKWNGTGYPDGLKGEEIPIGARILSAVDFLDALASDRQYRRAVTLNDAMERMKEEAGKSFDPRVVDCLAKNYHALEALAQSVQPTEWRQKLSTDLVVSRGHAPATGFEKNTASENPAGGDGNFLTSIAAARQEAQTLFELTQDLGNSLSLDETLSVLSLRLKKLVPYDSIVIYIKVDNKLIPEHVSGDNFRLFSSLQIPIGEGLSGWVAQNKKAIVNGNPSVEPGYMNDPTKFSTLRSALAVPLEGVNDVVGVLALYNAERDAFSKDHLRILLAISSKIALSIQNALKYKQAESSATTDYLTELPNARSLFLHLDREIARCRREAASLAVMVCDLNGFKQVNDRFGHQEGNRVLRIFAQYVRETCREYDYVARMGGDEFVLVIPRMQPQAAHERAVQLSELATRAGLEVCGEEILSLSAGLAFYPTDGQDAEEVLANADRSMYQVKQRHYEARAALLEGDASANAIATR